MSVKHAKASGAYSTSVILRRRLNPRTLAVLLRHTRMTKLRGPELAIDYCCQRGTAKTVFIGFCSTSREFLAINGFGRVIVANDLQI